MKYLFITLVLISIGCSQDDNDPEVINEPAGSAEYFINNLSTKNLDIVFVKSVELGFGIDSTKTVTSQEVLKIFQDGIIGVNPKPTNSFKEIRFFDASNTSDEPLFEITEINNNDWIITEQDLGDSGYGLTKYQLTISDEDFN